jgi:predicted Rossmann-fold nucleotide-binding protein
VKESLGLYVLGVMGYAGDWERSGKAGRAKERLVEDARELLRAVIGGAYERHGDRLAVASGAADEGVLELAYALCAELGVRAVGIAPRSVYAHPIARLDHLVIEGTCFGEESRLFVETSDALLLIGGGPQCDSEARMAARLGKLLTVARGFGGCGDELTPADLPGAAFVAARAGE